MVAKRRQFKAIQNVSDLMPRGKRGKRQLGLFSGATMLATIAVICALAVAPAFQKFALKSPQTAAVVSAVLTDLLNGDRAANNLGLLKTDPKLVAAAQAKADDMVAKGYFAHKSPDGHDSWYWFKQTGYDFVYAGENLAVDFSESGDVERAWMNSPSHRENILNPHFTEIGIATAVGMYQGRLTVFAVQMFGSEREESTPPMPVTVVSSPENPQEIALAQTATASPAVLAESTKPISKPKVAIAVPPKRTAIAQPSQNTTVAQIPFDKVIIVSHVPWWGHLVASPKSSLFYAYFVIAIFLALLLGWFTDWEFHRHHWKHAAEASFVIGLMSALFVVSQYFFFVDPVIAAVG